MKDLLFGAADKYTWSQVKPWAESIRKSGFDGDVVLLVYRVDVSEFLPKAKELNIDLFHTDADNWGNQISHEERQRDTVCHQLRFFHLWQFLSSTQEQYRYVITTDTRDVIFQRNPIEWLEQRITSNQFIAPSEGILYKDEPWGVENLVNGFGPYLLERLSPTEVHNVGTIAGTASAIRDLSLIIYSMGEERYIPNDQSGFNILVSSDLLNPIRVKHDEGWACQCGVMLDPEKVDRYREYWVGPQPVVKDGEAYTSTGEKYYLLHQWDRVPELKSMVERVYG